MRFLIRVNIYHLIIYARSTRGLARLSLRSQETSRGFINENYTAAIEDHIGTKLQKALANARKCANAVTEYQINRYDSIREFKVVRSNRSCS